MAKQLKDKKDTRILCACGGEVKMKTVVTQGRMRHYAQCLACHKQARRPKQLKAYQ